MALKWCARCRTAETRTKYCVPCRPLAYKEHEKAGFWCEGVLRVCAELRGLLPADFMQGLWDLQGGRCGICGDPLHPAQFQVDHIVPVSLGGSHEVSNLQLTHARCNVLKGRQDPVSFWQSRGFLL